MDITTFNSRKKELLEQYTRQYDELKATGASFAERKLLALKMKLLKEMREPPADLPPFDWQPVWELHDSLALNLTGQEPDFDHYV